MIRRGPVRWTLLILLLLAPYVRAVDPPLSAAARQEVLKQLGDQVRNTMGEPAWLDLLAKWQDRLDQAGTENLFYTTVNQMLRSDGKSHFVVVSPELQKSRGSDDGKDVRGQAGLTAALVEGQAVITHVEPDSPAAAAKLKPGYALTAVNGWPTAPLLANLKNSQWPLNKQRQYLTTTLLFQLAGEIGSEVKLQYLDEQNQAQTAVLKRQQPEGEVVKFGDLPAWRMTFSSELLADGKVGYLRFNIFLLPLLPKIKAAIKSFRECEGIIIDLRGNPGGFGMMAIPVAAAFYGEKTSLGSSKMTESNITYTILPVAKPYAGKVLILTDELSASTSEVLAGGMQENGRAQVVGQQTMGAVLPSLIVKLPSGAQLQYPIGDFKTPKGVSLEGRGVIPDVAVGLTRKDLFALGDPVLAKAIELIRGAAAPAEKGTSQ